MRKSSATWCAKRISQYHNKADKTFFLVATCLSWSSCTCESDLGSLSCHPRALRFKSFDARILFLILSRTFSRPDSRHLSGFTECDSRSCGYYHRSAQAKLGECYWSGGAEWNASLGAESPLCCLIKPLSTAPDP